MPKPYGYHFPPRIHVGYSTDGGDAATGAISSGVQVVNIIEYDEQIGSYAVRYTPESPYTPTRHWARSMKAERGSYTGRKTSLTGAKL